MIELELPYPPSVNHYWRHYRGRTLISRGGRAFRDAVRAALAAAGTKPLSGPLAVAVEVYPPDRRRRDILGTVLHREEPFRPAGRAVAVLVGVDGGAELRFVQLRCYDVSSSLALSTFAIILDT